MAADYIASFMESNGFTCSREDFPCVGGIQLSYAVAMATGLAASLLVSGAGTARRALGLALAALMEAMVLGESTTLARPAGALLPRKRGMNLICRKGDGTPRVVVAAHYDTVNQGSAFKPSRLRFVRPGFLAYNTFPVLTVLLRNRRSAARLLQMAMVAGCASMLQWYLLGRRNPGANDNASGVAVSMEAAARSASRGIDDIWFVFTDAEECGLMGMEAFCGAHSLEIREAPIINLDSVGSGRLFLLEREGMLFRFRAYSPLIELLDGCARRQGLDPGRSRNPGYTTDALPALVRGLRAASISRLDRRGYIANWHWEDCMDGIDREELERTVDFLEEVLCRASAPGAPDGGPSATRLTRAS